MPFVTTEEMLRDAQAGGYAVGAFNAENMEMIEAILAAAEEMKAPVIIQTTPGTVGYGGLAAYAACARACAEHSPVPAALHLDHGNSFGLCAQAFRAGYSSVMIDGSGLPFGENVGLTRRVAEMCAPAGIPVEGELGTIGGKEDGAEASGGCTDPAQAAEFAEETGISSLAAAIGTVHGFYRTAPVLDLERLGQIRRAVRVPLVLHGASGLTDDQVKACVRRGVCKVNFATELRAAYTAAVRKVLAEKPDAVDPKIFGKAARESVAALVRHRIAVCRGD